MTIEFYAYEGGSESPEAERKRMQELAEKLRASDDIEQYHTMQGFSYTPPSSTTGYTTTDILPELTGVPLSNIVLAYVHAFHPTEIRVSYGEVYCTAMRGRVTICCNDEKKVTRIYQEIEILYGCGAEVGGNLRAIKENLPAPESTPRTIGHTSALARANFL